KARAPTLRARPGQGRATMAKRLTAPPPTGLSTPSSLAPSTRPYGAAHSADGAGGCTPAVYTPLSTPARKPQPASRAKRPAAAPTTSTGHARAGAATTRPRQIRPPAHADPARTWTQSTAVLGVTSPQSAAWPVRLVVSATMAASASAVARVSRERPAA